MNHCDDCSACCNWLDIPALEKPAHVLCRHSANNRCSIYDAPERPATCSEFRCAFHINDEWPADLRPDRCGVIFQPCSPTHEPIVFLANVDITRPDSWRGGAARSAIVQLVNKGYGVVVLCGNETHVIAPKGKTPAMVLDEVNSIWESFKP